MSPEVVRMRAESARAPATVIVGVRLDCRSKELLTWALVKIAQPGDLVLALHVLNHQDTVNQKENYSLLSLVKAFDSVLDVYEGFCNLKQVDLKIKIRRGSSVKKVLVSEARTYPSCTVIVGASEKSHMIRSSSSLAKYCSRKLPRNYCMLAVSKGIVKFQSGDKAQGKRERFIQMFHRSSSSKRNTDGDENDGTVRDNSMSVVALKKIETLSPSSSTNLKLGWPLLHGDILYNILKWAMELRRDEPHEQEGQIGAIVPLDNQTPLAQTYHELVCFPRKYSSCRLFEYKELLYATSNFSMENLIGEGGNSRVYRGCLNNGREIAVKVMDSTKNVLKEFTLEIEVLTSISHVNIVLLLGFCSMDQKFIIVYDFFSRGSLEENLLRKDSEAFGWKERFKVAVGVANALDYLHSSHTRSLIHGDVKSANILLCDDFEPRLSDFGLAKWAPNSSSQIMCSDVTGTFGYLAPEYFVYGQVNEKMDVYAFGVVLLELLTGQKAISNDCVKGTTSLVMRGRPLLTSGKYSKLLDQSLGSDYNCAEIERMGLAASLCIGPDPWARPKMNLILKLLQGEEDATKWAKVQMDDSFESSPRCNIEAHLRLAYLDLDEDSDSICSVDL